MLRTDGVHSGQRSTSVITSQTVDGAAATSVTIENSDKRECQSRQTVGSMRRTFGSGALPAGWFPLTSGCSGRDIFGSAFGSTAIIVRPHTTLLDECARGSPSTGMACGSVSLSWFG